MRDLNAVLNERHAFARVVFQPVFLRFLAIRETKKATERNVGRFLEAFSFSLDEFVDIEINLDALKLHCLCLSSASFSSISTPKTPSRSFRSF